MACGGCAARRAAEAARAIEYVWTSSDGNTEIIYPSESIAKAKVMRRGGSYVPRNKAG